VSRDGGATWNDVTANIPDLPPLGTVRNIDASRWDAGKAYLTVDFHQVGGFDPYVYKTEDFGESWTRITDGVPPSMLSYPRFIHEDPVRPGLLYLGTENALYISFNDGVTWQAFQGDLPHSPIYGMVVQEHFNDLVIGTYGRGFWVLDDVTPLQQLTPEVAASDVHLFEPRPAYRFRPVTPITPMFDDWSAGEDPPEGASLNYWLAEAVEGGVTILISDEAGELIRTLRGPGEAGLNRVWWNFRGEPSTQIRLRTKPLYADWVEIGPSGWRAANRGRITALAPPGTYTVTLEVGGESRTAELEVMKDPHSEGSLADIQAQRAMVFQLREDYNQAAELINDIEWIRRQLYDLKPLVEEHADRLPEAEGITEAADALDAKLISVEEELYQMKLTGTGQDGVRWPAMLIGKLTHLAGAVQTADFRPTDQAREVHQVLETKLREAQAAYAAVMQDDLPALNRLLEAAGLGVVGVPGG
jgi:hypothetical protein